MRIIAGSISWGKRMLKRVPDGVLLALMVILVASFSFWLGFGAGKEMGEKGEVHIVEQKLIEASLGGTSLAPTASTQAEVPLSAGGQYVASKTGKSYHLPWCGGAKQIKEENKVWFNSKEEAESAGYAPAGNCPGI